MPPLGRNQPSGFILSDTTGRICISYRRIYLSLWGFPDAHSHRAGSPQPRGEYSRVSHSESCFTKSSVRAKASGGGIDNSV